MHRIRNKDVNRIKICVGKKKEILVWMNESMSQVQGKKVN
jgi:hypothetical protein